jgi:hypothetical protein
MRTFVSVSKGARVTEALGDASAASQKEWDSFKASLASANGYKGKGKKEDDLRKEEKRRRDRNDFSFLLTHRSLL